MKVGVVLPTFRDDATEALAVAQLCEELALDGVFAYDHLWPMGSPTRPSLAPLPVLAAVASRHSTLHVGPLVARVGMVSNAHLVGQLRTLARVAPGRVIAAVGTGDAKSRDELEGYGLTFASADDRRRDVDEVTAALAGEMTVWVGAGAPATNELAWARGITLNVWGATPDAVATMAQRGPVTWAGPAEEDVVRQLDALEASGAHWAVFAPGGDLRALAHWRHRR